MLKPKEVFTALSVWFLFHIIVFFILGPMGVQQISGLSEKAFFVIGIDNQLAGSMALVIGVVMFLCRGVDLENSKKILIGIGVCLVIMDILLLKVRLVDIPNNYPESADYLNAPLFAMVIWILLPIYSLYVGITAKED